MFKKRREIQKLKLINKHLYDVVSTQNESYEVLSDEYKKLANKYFKSNDEIEELKAKLTEAETTIELLNDVITTKDNEYTKLSDEYKEAMADKMAAQLNELLLTEELNKLKGIEAPEPDHGMEKLSEELKENE